MVDKKIKKTDLNDKRIDTIIDESLLKLEGSDSHLQTHKVPENLLKLIDEVERKEKQKLESKKSNKFEFLRNNFAVAAMSLCIGVFGNSFFTEKGQDSMLFRNSVTNGEYDSTILLLTKEKTLKPGNAIKDGSKYQIYVKSQIGGNLSIDFPEDEIYFNENVDIGDEVIFPKDINKKFKSTKPYVFFTVNIKNKEFEFKKDYYFVVK